MLKRRCTCARIHRYYDVSHTYCGAEPAELWPQHKKTGGAANLYDILSNQTEISYHGVSCISSLCPSPAGDSLYYGFSATGRTFRISSTGRFFTTTRFYPDFRPQKALTILRVVIIRLPLRNRWMRSCCYVIIIRNSSNNIRTKDAATVFY